MKAKHIVPVILGILLLLVAAGILAARVLPSVLAQYGDKPSLEVTDGNTEMFTEETELLPTYTEVLSSLATDPLHIHSFDRHVYTKKPTCEDEGYKQYVCACGMGQPKDFVEALGHDFGGWKTDPEDPGQEVSICRNCGAARYRDGNGTVYTEEPTQKPTEKPTEAPTEAPTEKPTEAPTEAPTEKPTEAPTEVPTEKPTEKPTEEPTEAPTEKPTVKVELLTSHPVIITDILNGEILVADLDKTDPFAKKNLIWQWSPSAQQGWGNITKSKLENAVSGVKYRWSAYFKTNVVLFTSSRNVVGMIEYPSGKCLWKAEVKYSPHSIELLPNGDIVVASSGGGTWEDGRLTYFELNGKGQYVKTTEHMLYSAHGVAWDPENNVLWASGFQAVEAYQMTTKQGKATLTKVSGKGATIADGSGHDLIQDYANSDILWVTTNKSILQFSKSRNAFLNEFPNSGTLKRMTGVKGVAGFSDGVVAYASYGDKGQASHPGIVRSEWPGNDGGFETVKYIDDSRGWNKLRVFTEQYL